MNSYSKKIKRARTYDNRTLLSMAQNLGITKTAYYYYDSGSALPSPALNKKICRILNLDEVAMAKLIRTEQKKISNAKINLKWSGVIST